MYSVSGVGTDHAKAHNIFLGCIFDSPRRIAEEFCAFAKKIGTPLLLFPSIRKVWAAGFAKSRGEVFKKAKNNIDGWYFPLQDVEGKPKKGSYTLKTGEISYEMYKENPLEFRE